jgi:hypothetical protein
VSDHRVGPTLSLVRQALSIGREFGVHSLEALLGVAETLEDSVYARGSLRRSGDGLSFALANPPLRMGAFSSVRVLLDGVAVPPGEIRVRPAEGGAWRTANEIHRAAPLELRPGEPTEISVEHATVGEGLAVTVRLELQNVAIPPLVWFEFTEVPRPEGVA